MIILPSLGLLYVLDQKSLLEGEGVEDDTPSTGADTTRSR